MALEIRKCLGEPGRSSFKVVGTRVGLWELVPSGVIGFSLGLRS
jgi:hypothetical protein